MIASGKAVGEIAEEIHLSVATVSTYRARILLKMSMNTTAELIRYAIENRLVVYRKPSHFFQLSISQSSLQRDLRTGALFFILASACSCHTNNDMVDPSKSTEESHLHR